MKKPPAPIDATVEIRREFDYDNPQTGAGYEAIKANYNQGRCCGFTGKVKKASLYQQQG